MSGAIEAEALGKAYKRYGSRWARVIEWLDPRRARRHEQRWVLRGVSFRVNPGEAVGIIGHNGAGKSTLLKMIAGTTRPTEGTIRVNGRVHALLELGMGFHPDFTGRQNVIMAGQLLGMAVAEIEQRMGEIEAFAEIGDYIDQPVRTYSSGMQVRLAFSVATCMRPEILIVDEALSVGDAYFQHKSFDRIRQFREAGSTLLFVSHAPAAVKTLCDRAILLDGGGVVKDGRPDEVLDYYNAIIARREAQDAIRQTEASAGRRCTRSGGNQASIIDVEMLGPDGKACRAVVSGESVTVRVRFTVNASIAALTVGILLRDVLGNDVFGTNTYHHQRVLSDPRPGSGYSAEFSFPSLQIGQGSYSVSVALHAGDSHTAGNYDWWDQSLVFQVVRGRRPFSIGVCDLPLTVKVCDSNAMEEV